MTILDMVEQIKKDFCLDGEIEEYYENIEYYNLSNIFYFTYYKKNPRYVNICDKHFALYTKVYVGKTDFFYKKIKNILKNSPFMQEHIRKVKIQKIKEMI